MNRFDVVVVGGGPAGSAAAIGCAQRGWQVALIERHAFPRFRPGESLHPGIEPLLQQLGVAERLCGMDAMRFHGHWVQWNAPPRYIGFGGDDDGPWRGFQIARARLDMALLQRAAALGVTVRQPCRARRVLIHQHRVIGVETDTGPLFASYVLDASGASGWLGRRLQLPLRRCSPPLQVRFGYLDGHIAPYSQTPHLLADTDGWTWLAQVEEQTLHWARQTFEAQRLTRGDHPPCALPEPLRNLPPRGRPRSADVTWRISAAPAGSGYFIAGDAASQLDPASSHGVLKALMTGMQAAQAISDCLRHPALQTAAQSQYSQWLSDWFERDKAQLQRFYRLHPCPPRWLPTDE
ncbi:MULTISPECIES: NAD(P)/FAD-dependent oxidoreductase [unclassified Pseudomonas]|uniref:NAD(P)/FAD-dependent oxidoreductase n=1 Tax=unclassified Pseudomonas TaxID=196821 RepID=UPI000A1FC725|nr:MULTISPECIES: FAD-dependent oxidoreductase [unclassified Pseudomonas]